MLFPHVRASVCCDLNEGIANVQLRWKVSPELASVCAFLCQRLLQYNLGHAAIVASRPGVQGCRALDGCLLGKSKSDTSLYVKQHFPEGESYQGVQRAFLHNSCVQRPVHTAISCV